MSDENLYDIAIVGMAGRFPGAADLDELWEVLRRGAETLSFFSEEELERSGVSAALRGHPAYVRSRGVLRDPDLFDAAFFGVSPREARILDPQQRVFLECAWEALENAACSPERAGAVGVYAGCSQSTYVFRHLLGNPEVAQSVGALEIKLGNDRDFLTTATSYRLNLQGPSVNVATACSTSLVAVHLACQALLSRECDVALAGGVSVTFPQKIGHVYQEGGILSADGHVRAFDAGATGSVGGDGVGVVVLKRLTDALRDGDPVRAVIKGSAINNDGSLKIGFTAPSVEGQAAVVTEAQNVAGIDPATISYIETHGSGTPLGDPVEVRALTRAFRAGTDETGFCAIGSIKTNLGHTDAAAGVAGLIKTVLALERRLIPPSVHFERPNPEISFEQTPFYVAARLADWTAQDGHPRRAGVNSFGIGGTNAHVVVEEAPEREPSGASRLWQLLVLSAATPAALESTTDRLAAHLQSHPEESLADVAWTGQVGRRPLRFRRALVGRDRADALAALRDRDSRRLVTRESLGGRPVAFLFPGVGDHYPGMARGLYESEPVFRREIDRSAEILRPLLGLDLREIFTAPAEAAGEAGTDLRRMLGRSDGAGASGPLGRTEVLQPAVFAVEMALARLWESWGVQPAALLGYSLGEYAAACQAGVFSLEDGLRIVAERARRIAALPEGGMLAVALAEGELAELLEKDLDLAAVDLAAVNAPELSVVAGPRDALAALEEKLAARGISCRSLPTSHAFHSAMMDPAVDGFARFLETVPLAPPRVPYITNVTGIWVTAEEATDPAHWARHLRSPVQYAAGLRALWSEPLRALLEVGPGHGLTTLALQQAGGDSERVAVPSLRAAYAREDDQAFLLGAASRLWVAGVEIDWEALHAGETRRKLALPTYPFQRQRYWVERPAVSTASAAVPAEAPPPADAPAGYARPELRTRYAEPRTDSERTVAAIWREVLALEQVGIHDSFFELGGHSLLAPRVLLRVAQELGADVPLATLLEAPTVADLAAAVDRRLRGEDSPAASPPPPLDLEAEVVLAPDIRRDPPAGDLPSLDDAEAVVLTGASGFLGAYILRDLLEQTRAEVHCLVRAESVEQGRERILRNLAAHGLAPADPQRIVPVPGNLAEPRWGLADADFRALAERAGTIFHAGAWVNFTYPYGLLKPANVGGTDEALRLAALGRPKAVHFVSSLSAFAAGSFTPEGVALESSTLPAHRGLFGGYPQTKWVAERRIALARERGLPVAVYRPGVISGDATSGIGNTRDLLWGFLKACLQMEMAPEGVPGRFDPVPVDFVSRAILHLARRPDSLGRAFHLFNPHPMAWSEVFAGLADAGHPLRIVPADVWNRELERQVWTAEENALAPFWPLLAGRGGNATGNATANVTEAPRPDPAPARGFRFDDRQAREELAGAPFACPPADRALLGLYIQSLQESGFFPSPAAGRKGAA